ncbi:MAG TPA: hypothetical protein VFB20_08930 [Burkholderiales bacterium]|nr:hypothetical protein [Burkholderiales bacterium]
MNEIERADLRRRRRVLAIVLVGAAIGVVLFWTFDRYRPVLEAWLDAAPSGSAGRLGIILAAIAVLACVPLLGLAGYLWSLGRRVVRARRYPLPGSAVYRDTRVFRDRAAIRRGRLLQTLAAMFLLAGVGLSFALWRLWALLPVNGG